MKKGWQITTLGEVCGFVRGPFGGSLKKSVFVEDGFAVYEQQHAIYNQFVEIRYFIDGAKFQEMQRFELRPNDLIMSCSGTMGRVAMVPDNIRRGIINQALLKLTPSSAVLPEFLRYWMGSADFQGSLKEQSGGAAIQNVASVGILKQIRISLPPLPEQRRIVGILDEAFEGIATAKGNAEKNLQNARALFESHLQSIFTQRSKGWVEKSLASLCSIFVDSAHRTPKYQAEGIPALRPRDVVNGQLALTTAARVSEEEYEIQSRRHRPAPGDIVYSRELSYGWAATLPDSPRVCLSQGMCLFRPTPDLNRAFLLYVLNGPFGREQARLAAVGASHPHINLGDIKEYRIPLPSLSKQLQIIRHFDAMSAEIQRLEAIYRQKLAALDELKKSLLHHAFSGQL